MSLAECYACVCAREFAAQALLRLRPELRNRPCVVMEGKAPLEQVCGLNDAARALGAALRMTKVEVETFPQLSVLARSVEEEANAKAALLECAGGFSPRVEECSEDALFLCVLDIAGTEKLFGPPATLARALLSRMEGLGIAACIAVSGDFHAAIAAAKGLTARSPVRVIAGGEEREALAALPLAILDMKEEQAETFALWGIRTLGMLGNLPEKELIARMGQAGRRLRQLARGELPHLFQPVEPAFALAERMELDSPVEALDALLLVVNLLLEQLIVRATARVLALASVSIRLKLEGGATQCRTVRPALPTNDRQIWLKLLHLDLEAHPPQAAILAVDLEAEPGATGKVQLGLFSPQLPEAGRLDVTLARIRAIVGEENVGRAVLNDSHERDAFRMEPFELDSFAVPSSAQSLVAAAGARPAQRQIRPAENVRVSLERERPATFVFREQMYTVERAYGPWLSSGNWWAPTLWAGEQWDLVARSRDGALLCCSVVRDALREQWQMAALYD